MKVESFLVSGNDSYIDVDVYVKQPDGSEFLQRVYVEKSSPSKFIRDEIRFSKGPSQVFDDGGEVPCPADVLSALDAHMPIVEKKINDACLQRDGHPGEMKDFTVIASYALEGTLKVFNARATNGLHAFGVVAQREKDNHDLEFLVALPGKQVEGTDFDLPGEGIVCMETVLEQTDVFGSHEAVDRPRG